MEHPALPDQLVSGMKRRAIEKWRGLLDRLQRSWPENWLGETNVLERHFSHQYGRKNISETIAAAQRRNMVYYLLTLAAFSVMIFLCGQTVLTEPAKVDEIYRPAFDETTNALNLRATLRYGEVEVKRDVRLRLAPEILSQAEAERELDQVIGELPDIIQAANPSLDQVCQDLNLPNSLRGGTVRLEWVSDQPELIDETGKFDPLAAQTGQTVHLSALVELAGHSREVIIPVCLSCPPAFDPEAAMLKRLDASVRKIEAARDKQRIELPVELADKVDVRWQTAKSGPPIGALILIVGLFPLIYINRYQRAKQEFFHYQRRIIREIPDFIDKLVLLLNAGLVSEAALRKIADDYKKHLSYVGQSPLYDALIEIDRRVAQTNSSLIGELRSFSQSSGVRELMRFAAIFDDNLDKGSTLSEKLEAEAELLWMNRKKQAEESGRLAESRLTFPMMLLLMALIMITIAPVLLRM